MDWLQRQQKQLQAALSNGSITQGEYDAAWSGAQGRWDTKQANMANFQKAAGPLSMVGSVAGQFSNMNGSIDAGAAQAREGMRGAIGQMGPWGAAIAAATGVVDAVTDATGIALNTVDKNAASRAGAGAAAGFNNLVASLPGFSFLGGLTGETDTANKSQFIDGMSNSYGGSVQDINAAQELGGKRTLFGKRKMNNFIQEQNRVNNMITSISMQSELAKQNDAGQLYQQQNANKYAGYSPRLLMSKKGSKFPELDSARALLKNLNKNKETGLVMNAIDKDIQTLSNPDSGANISSTTAQLAADYTDNKLQQDELQLLIKNQIYDNAQDPEGIVMKIVENLDANKDILKRSFIKNGFEKEAELLNNVDSPESLRTISEVLRHIIHNRSYSEGGEIGKFQLGGKIDKNFIPQGALHKNKHHLEDVNPELEGSITKKGIPVVSMDEGGEIQQHAEVEKNEIVFSLGTTKTVEDFYRQYQETEDENILIECGKFLTTELIKNTEDPGKLRKTIE